MLIISSVGGICPQMDARRQPSSWTTLSVQLMDAQPTAPYAVPPASTGTFTVIPFNFAGQLPTHAATAGFNLTDGLCHNVVSGNAVSGSVTLTRNDSGAYSGSFDLTFDSGDHVTGAFEAAHCPGIETLLRAAQNNTVSCG